MNKQEKMEFWKQVYLAMVSSHDEGDSSICIAQVAESVAHRAVESLESANIKFKD